MRAENRKKETKSTTKNQFSEKINKKDQPQVRLTREKEDTTHQFQK